MNKRFAELWNDYLEGDPDEAGLAELRQLLQEDERLLQFAADYYQTHRLLGLLMQDSDARHDSFVRETLRRIPLQTDEFVRVVVQQLPMKASGQPTASKSKAA